MVVGRVVGLWLPALALVLAACGQSNGSGQSATPDNADESSQTVTGPSDAGSEPSDVEETVPGVTATSVLFGQSAALEGPTAALGLGMRLGIEAAFAEVNAAGGVNGRQVELVSLDDGYEPRAALANTLELIDQGVFALIGETGTPTSEVAAPAAAAADVPFVGAFTGADLLRDGRLDNVINMRASYAEEVETMIDYITTDLGLTRIGVLSQEDSFGRDVYRSIQKSLARRDLVPTAVNFYPRNTNAVKRATLHYIGTRPQAIIMISSYEPASGLISWSDRLDFDPVFLALSFVGTEALADSLRNVSQRVLITQVVPIPTDRDIAYVDAYLGALDAYDPTATPGFVSLEGYLTGRMAIEGVRRCGDELTQQCFTEAILGADLLDIDGLRLTFNDDEADGAEDFVDNQGSSQVFLTELNSDGTYSSVPYSPGATP